MTFEDVKAKYELTGWIGVIYSLKDIPHSFTVVEFNSIDFQSTESLREAYIDAINGRIDNLQSEKLFCFAAKTHSGHTEYNPTALRASIVSWMKP